MVGNAGKIAGVLGGLAAVLGLAGCSTIGDDEVEPGTAAYPAAAAASDALEPGWTEWRGFRKDATVAGITLPATLPEGEWPEQWRVKVGQGFSGIIASGERVYCHSRVGETEVVSCHDARTGDVIWSRPNQIEDWSQHLFASGISDGPLATPTLVDGRLYTVGVYGLLQCFEASGGQLVFSVDSQTLDGAESEYMYGHATSPLVRDGKVFVCFSTSESGQLVALDAITGQLEWRALKESVTYTSPVLATLHGRPQIILRTWERLVGLDTDTGAVLWEHAAEAGGLRRDCATPLVAGQVIYITNNFHGTIAVRIDRTADGQWRAERLYRSGALSGGTASPVYRADHLYGLHKRGFFVCMDARTGKRVWIERHFGEHLSLISFDDEVLALDEEGHLARIELSPESFQAVAEWKVGEYTWGHPGIDANRLYFRDGEDLVCLRLSPPTVAKR